MHSCQLFKKESRDRPHPLATPTDSTHFNASAAASWSHVFYEAAAFYTNRPGHALHGEESATNEHTRTLRTRRNVARIRSREQATPCTRAHT